MLSQRTLHTHRNHFLFADYYLDNRVMEQAEWREVDVSAPFQAITGLWRGYHPHHDNEPQTETDWIQPVLKSMGHTFNVQAALKTPFGVRKPDYFLYPNEAARRAARAKGGPFDSRDLAGALAVADAKAWERSLDTAGRPTPLTKKLNLSENPSLQIYIYVLYSGLAWGLLTNGRYWRLVHRDSAEALDVYYEVDLPALLDQGDPEAFKYFYLFFRREAFEDRSEAPAWLGRVLAQSRAYARGVGDTLKEQVYEAQRCLAQGFLDFPANGLRPTPETLKAIYDNSLIVLYRLLFVFYAESRGLLPVPDNAAYSYSYSLDALKKRLARDLDAGRPAASSMAAVWQQLDGLWQVIDSGNPDLDVPAYNGGLFKRRPDGFLEQYRVGDSHLRRAIDLLARAVDPDSKRRVFVDYRDLEIRHLGSIYEGLLEYRVQVADLPLAVRSEKGREVYAPVEAGGRADVLPGHVYLATDKGERKATGSYYTPDFVVKYIVEQTIGPALAALQAQYGNAAGDITDPAALAGAILGLNILDPSMGSGHFLVEATDFIARSIVALDLPRPGGEPGESDLAYWRRRAAQSCIYGVDLNPLAVELAKLSLWLRTVAKGKPLSFLDHHLRCGNSLVGARAADLGLDGPVGRGQSRQRRQQEAQARAAGQLSMLDDSAFAGSMRTAGSFMSQIESLRSDTLAEVRQAEQLYRQVVEDVTARARQLADAWTARSFGLELDQTAWAGLAQYLLHGGFELPGYRRLLDRAGQLAAEHRFFHWELEFPEVFFDPSGGLVPGGGFDAVIGNPPYVRQEQMSALKPYLAQAHSPVYDGVADIYVYFYHQGLELLRTGGRLSYIVNNKWLRAGYGEPLRGYFAASARIQQIVDFGHAPIFPDADTFPCIIVLQKPGQGDEPETQAQTEVCQFPRQALGQEELDVYVRQHSYRVPMKRFSSAPWSLERADVEDLMEKIWRAGIPLKDFIGATPSYGVKTGFNPAFLIDTATREQLIRQDPNCAGIIKPYLRGQDVKRWTPDWAGLWIILLKSSGDYPWPWADAPDRAEEILAQTYPALHRYFKPMEDNLRKRQDQGRYWWELRSCAYYDQFDKPKLAYQEIQFHPAYSYDTQGYLSNNKVFILPNANLYVLAVLNSPLMWWHNWRYLPHMKDEALNPMGVLMEKLPIARPSEVIRAGVEPAVERLLSLTGEQRQARGSVLDWLRLEFDLDRPGQKLSAFETLGEDDFIKEVERRPRPSARLKPADVAALRNAYREYAPRLHSLQAETRKLEQDLAALVNLAYGLTPEEIDLLWRTAPPRMPVEPSK